MKDINRDTLIELLSDLLDNQRPYPNAEAPGTEEYARVRGMNEHANRTHNLILQRAAEFGITREEITIERGPSIPAWRY